jgi:predicted nuclease with TOPRIM domain
MARKTTTATTRKKKAVAPQAPAAVGLALSDLRLRLEFLEKNNEKLLQNISKKRTEIDNLVDRIQAVAMEMTQRSAPVLQQMLDLDQKIHAVFAEILNGRKLGKQSRLDIQRIYRHMQISGLLSPKLDSEGKPEKKLFDLDGFPDFDISDDPEWNWQQEQSVGGFHESAPKPDREELKKIRQLFLRLADVFHPDKAGPDADQEYHAEVMKEINQAYQNGDLAKLLAIEKQHQMGELIDRDSEDDLTRRCARLEQENEFLRSQFDSLKQELRLAKNSQEGMMATEHRKLTKRGIDPISAAIAEAEEQCQLVQDIHDFVVKFRDKKITIKEFLQGPPAIHSFEEIEMEELLMEFAEFSGINIHFSR